MMLVLVACVFQACGGSEDTKKDGSADGNVDMPDTGTVDTGTGMDSGDMDTGVTMDTGVDSGPTCTNTPCVIGLTVGGHHACALIQDGTVRCWGLNSRGQLGDGGTPKLIPEAVNGLASVSQVVASDSYTTFGATCAVVSGGGVLCLGSNGASQLGLSSMMATEDGLAHPNAAQVAGLPMSSMATLNTYMGCAVTNAGEYWCWGDNSAINQTQPGLLGRGNMPTGASIPGKATLLNDAGAMKAGAAGTWFNLALSSNGTIYSWGYNGLGDLGRMTNTQIDNTPGVVANITNATQIAAGEDHACAIANNQVLCWGANDFGQLGRGIATPNQGSNNPLAVTIPGNKNAAQVACSNAHTCVLATDGSVYCWGRNNAGQVGPNGGMDGGFNSGNVTTPQQVNLPAKALAVGTGGTNTNQTATGYSCALLEGGNVYCWGYNGDGELGRSADAGALLNCNNTVGASCSPTPSSVIWQ